LFSLASGGRETRKKERKKERKSMLVNWMVPAAEDCGRSMDVVVEGEMTLYIARYLSPS
jgi:hypothetical protein